MSVSTAQIFTVFESIRERNAKYIRIAGGSCSGKTTLAKELKKYLEDKGYSATLICMDNFYKNLSEVPDKNLDKPEAINFEQLRKTLEDLIDGKEAIMPVHNFEKFQTEDYVQVQPADFIILEGLFALHPDLDFPIPNLTIYVEASEQARYNRRIKRDSTERGRPIDHIKSYWPKVVEMHKRYVEPQKSEANITVFTDEYSASGIS